MRKGSGRGGRNWLTESDQLGQMLEREVKTLSRRGERFSHVKTTGDLDKNPFVEGVGVTA